MNKLVALAATVALGGAVMSPTVSNAQPAEQPKSAQSRERVLPQANGIIVKSRAAKSTLERAAQSSLGNDVDVTGLRKSSGSRSLILVDQPLDGETAAAAATEIALRGDVEWAVPNYRFKSTATSPIVPNDPRFSEQRGVWDAYAANAGGYSAKAPYAWSSTKGADALVAVVDTGVVPTHPEFSGQLVSGYDFISDLYTSNDGDGRDSNPSDPGDWIPVGDDYCYGEELEEQEDSSWHGTHVAGIIAAKQGNGVGISGIAPDVKVQPVRVLGRCGGDLDDILDGIDWASGAPIYGTPSNTTPADVINLSLGADFYGAPKSIVKDVCSVFNSVIKGALQRGSVTVIATGNSYDDKLYSVPARCGEGIAVTATRDDGFLSSFANAGTGTDIAAPGGDQDFGRSGILSAVDSGLDSPQSPSYDSYDGTSMATPAVSAAAALFIASGMHPSRVKTALQKSVQSFPSSSSKKKGDVAEEGWTLYRNLNCSSKRCGTGILDLSKAPLPVDEPTITGQPGVGQKLTASKGLWSSASQPSVTYQWLVDGMSIRKATKSTYTVPKSYYGRSISVRVNPKNSGFTTLSQTSTPVVIGTGMSISASKSVSYGSKTSISVYVQDQRGAARDRAVQLMIDGADFGAPVTTSSKGKATFSTIATWAVGSHTVSARMVDGLDAGAPKPVTLTMVKASSSVTQSVSSKVKTGVTFPLKVTVKSTVGVSVDGTLTVKDGATVLKTVAVDPSGLTVIDLMLISRGKHSITATYGGNINVNMKTSSKKTVTVY